MEGGPRTFRSLLKFLGSALELGDDENLSAWILEGVRAMEDHKKVIGPTPCMQAFTQTREAEDKRIREQEERRRHWVIPELTQDMGSRKSKKGVKRKRKVTDSEGDEEERIEPAGKKTKGDSEDEDRPDGEDEDGLEGEDEDGLEGPGRNEPNDDIEG
jgi:hypothetical protein